MNAPRSQDGISLLEVLVGTVLLSTIGAGLAATTISVIRANLVSKQTAAATALVQDKIEQFRALDPGANPDLGAGQHVDPLNPLTPLGQAQGSFNRSWVVNTTNTLGLLEVVVDVTWDGGSRNVRSVTYVCQSTACG
ncbi:MAG: hypothetical protein ACE5I7_10110 [Candidatus Binatia bacterium]